MFPFLPLLKVIVVAGVAVFAVAAVMHAMHQHHSHQQESWHSQSKHHWDPPSDDHETQENHRDSNEEEDNQEAAHSTQPEPEGGVAQSNSYDEPRDPVSRSDTNQTAACSSMAASKTEGLRRRMHFPCAVMDENTDQSFDLPAPAAHRRSDSEPPFKTHVPRNEQESLANALQIRTSPIDSEGVPLRDDETFSEASFNYLISDVALSDRCENQSESGQSSHLSSSPRMGHVDGRLVSDVYMQILPPSDPILSRGSPAPSEASYDCLSSPGSPMSEASRISLESNRAEFPESEVTAKWNDHVSLPDLQIPPSSDPLQNEPFSRGSPAPSEASYDYLSSPGSPLSEASHVSLKSGSAAARNERISEDSMPFASHFE